MQLLKVAFAVVAALCYVSTAYAELPIGIRNGTDWKVGSGLIMCKEVNYGDCLVMTNRGGACSTVEVNTLNISEFNIFLSALPTPGHACELFYDERCNAHLPFLLTGNGFARPNQEPDLGWFFPPFWQSFQCWNASSRQPSLALNGASTVPWPTNGNMSGRWRTKFDGRRATSFSLSPTPSNLNLASTHGSFTQGTYGPLSTFSPSATAVSQLSPAMRSQLPNLQMRPGQSDQGSVCAEAFCVGGGSHGTTSDTLTSQSTTSISTTSQSVVTQGMASMLAEIMNEIHEGMRKLEHWSSNERSKSNDQPSHDPCRAGQPEVMDDTNSGAWAI